MRRREREVNRAWAEVQVCVCARALGDQEFDNFIHGSVFLGRSGSASTGGGVGEGWKCRYMAGVICVCMCVCVWIGEMRSQTKDNLEVE